MEVTGSSSRQATRRVKAARSCVLPKPPIEAQRLPLTGAPALPPLKPLRMAARRRLVERLNQSWTHAAALLRRPLLHVGEVVKHDDGVIT